MAEKVGKKNKDLTGQRFGRLVAVRKAEYKDKNGAALWICRCDCGNTCEKTTSHLISGAAKSCGCIRSEMGVREGDRFGRLTAVRALPERTASRAVIWECRCDCGNVVRVDAGNLMAGHTKSCGCLLREKGKSKFTDSLTYTDGTCLESLERIGSERVNTSPDTGARGVYLTKGGRYEARISFKKRKYYLGSYERLEEAVLARKLAEDEIKQHLDNYKNYGIPLPDELLLGRAVIKMAPQRGRMQAAM